MTKIGDKVKFYPFREYPTPFCDSPCEEKYAKDSLYCVEAIGTVEEIHEDHNYFRAVYGEDGKQHICFHFCDLGEKVWKVEEDKADE